mmetsp:Transcript_22773/g.21976  ORF Transcript_22773/g.21976 Transcript_22773/m.21976 type:complete len:167 (-) Transcript_22773:573-1073(-)
MFLFDIFYYFKRFKYWAAERKGERCKLTQREANFLAEGSQLFMSSRLSTNCNMLVVSLFFSPLVPMSIPLCFLGMTYAYLVEKYLLLYRHKIPEQLSSKLVGFLANLIPYFCLLWSFSLLIFNQRLFSQQFGSADALKKILGPLILLIIIVVLLFLPIRTCINYMI